MEAEKISEYVEKYMDDAYKFAFIVTLSDEGAASALKSAVGEMTEKELWDSADVRKELYTLLYRHAVNCGAEPMTAAAISGKYGKKSDDFYSFIALPVNERALCHLTVYEDMSEEDATKVIGK